MSAAYYDVVEVQAGYSSYSEEGIVAQSSCVLITGRYNCVVNNSDSLTTGACVNKLPTKIDYVISTNGDPGHIAYNHLFLETTHIVGHTLAIGDAHFFNALAYDKPIYIDNKKITIMPTPGSSQTDITVLVKTSQYTTVAITGGLIEKLEDLKNNYFWLLNRPECPGLQRYYRHMIINSVDRIIPDHGDPFNVTKEIKDSYKLHSDDEKRLSPREAYKIGLI